MNIEEYILSHSDVEPEYLAKVNRATHVKLINPRMCSGHLQGRVLSMFCHMIKPKRVLELGTLTGYSALCMAEALPEDAVLETIECDEELEDFILQNFAGSEHGHKIKLHIGDALTEIKKLDENFDLVFIVADNTLWDGKVLKPVDSNDKQTIEIMKFNDFVAKDSRVEKVMLPLRDG